MTKSLGRLLSRRRLLVLVPGLLLAGAVGGAVLLLLRPAERAAPGPSLAVVGDRRSFEFSGPALTPPPSQLRSRELRGTPVFLEVWGSWCVACRAEAPMLARLARSSAGVRFVGLDVEDSRRDGRDFVRRFGLGFPHVFDPKARLARRLGVFGVPTFFLIDRRGRLAATLVGKQTESTLVRLLRLLAAEPVAVRE